MDANVLQVHLNVLFRRDSAPDDLKHSGAALTAAIADLIIVNEGLSRELVAARASLVDAQAQRIGAELQLKTLQDAIGMALRTSLVPPQTSAGPAAERPATLVPPKFTVLDGGL